MRRNFAVLVVESHPVVRANAVSMFEELGFRVFDAYNGADGLKLLVANPEIGFLFTEVRMPGMSGIELTEAARRLRPDLKIVLTSGYKDATVLPDHVAFVPKPVGAGYLRALGLP